MPRNWKSACTWPSSRPGSSATSSSPSSTCCSRCSTTRRPPRCCAPARANIDDLRKRLTDFIKRATRPTVAGTDEVDTQPTLGFQRVIQRAILHVQSVSGKKEVTGANVLVAIFGEKDSHAVYFLHQQGVTRLDVVNYIAHGITKSDRSRSRPRRERRRQDEGERRQRERKGSPLDAVHAEPEPARHATARSIR